MLPSIPLAATTSQASSYIVLDSSQAYTSVAPAFLAHILNREKPKIRTTGKIISGTNCGVVSAEPNQILMENISPKDSSTSTYVKYSVAAISHSLLNGLLVLLIPPMVVEHKEMPALHQPVGHTVEVLSCFWVVWPQLQCFVKMTCSFISESHSG